MEKMDRWKFNCLQDKQNSIQTDKKHLQTCLFSKIPLEERNKISTIVDKDFRVIWDISKRGIKFLLLNLRKKQFSIHSYFCIETLYRILG